MNDIVKRCITGTSIVALVLLLSSPAFASEAYDERFSRYFEVRTGYTLTEQGVKEALEHFDNLDLNQSIAAIAVVGERRYKNLVADLKAIYHRRPEDVDKRRAYRYRSEMIMNHIRVVIARALIRCEDSEAEKYALEQVKKSPEMSIVPATWAVENLKYLVKFFRIDVSKEFDSLITSCTNSAERVDFGRGLAEYAFRELLETETYVRLTNHPTAQEYSQVIQKIRESAPSDLKRKYERHTQAAPRRWVENRKLLERRTKVTPSARSATAHAAVWYVDKDNASNARDGTSWGTAFTTIQEGVDAAFADGGGEVWVAEGVYGENRNTTMKNRWRGSIEMKEHVHLYGGFAGNETARDQRDWKAHVTVIDGSKSRGGLHAFHVVSGGGTHNATLDGFTITGGTGHGGGQGHDGLGHPSNQGGGMRNYRASPTVANCIFTGNSALGSGGGMYNRESSPTVTNCIFRANSARGAGGGMYNRESSPTVAKCTFESNSASSGGGMRNYKASPTVTDCAFKNNSSRMSGGGMCNTDSSAARVTACTLTGNSAKKGGGMHNSDSGPTRVTNCTFMSNSSEWAGGGMYNYRSSLQVSGCTFKENTATRDADLANTDSSPVLKDCTFEDK